MTKEHGLGTASTRIFRPHAHTLSAGFAIGKISRRKSSTSHTSSTALAAALAIRLENNASDGVTAPKASKAPHVANSLPAAHSLEGLTRLNSQSMGPLPEDENQTSRVRRASESFKDSGKKNKLKCDHCGKVYTHSSCLTKHMWEHTPEWGLTSQLQISKHQQVQLLEAASALINIRYPTQDSPENSSSDYSVSGETQEDGNSISPETTPSVGDSGAVQENHDKDYDYQYQQHAARHYSRPHRATVVNSGVFSQSYNSEQYRPSTAKTEVSDHSMSFDYQCTHTPRTDRYNSSYISDGGHVHPRGYSGDTLRVKHQGQESLVETVGSDGSDPWDSDDEMDHSDSVISQRGARHHPYNPSNSDQHDIFQME